MPPKRLIALTCLALIFGGSTAPAEEPLPVDTTITLQRGNCDGGCPVYRIVIFSDGDAVYFGRARTKKLGVVQTKIPYEQVQALVKQFEALDYFKLENIYSYQGAGCKGADLFTPNIVTSLSIGGRSKSLNHNGACGGEVGDKLTALENNIDKAVNSEIWVSGKRSKPKP